MDASSSSPLPLPRRQSSARAEKLSGRFIHSRSELKEALHEGEVLRVERDQLAQQVGGPGGDKRGAVHEGEVLRVERDQLAQQVGGPGGDKRGALHEGEVLRVERDQLAQQVGWECVGGENREGDC